MMYPFLDNSSLDMLYELGNFSNFSYGGNITLYYTYETYETYGKYDCGNFSSQEFSKLTIFFNTLLPVLCCIGILGIILTMVILSHKSMSTSTNAYLMSMASADLFYLLILSTKFLGEKFSGKDFYMFDIYFGYANVFLDTFFLASIWLTVMLTVERYIAICHPLRAMVICTVRRARWIIIGIYIFSFICNSLQFMRIKIIKGNHVCYKNDYFMLHLTEIGNSMIFRNLYAFIVICTLSAIIPFCLLLYFNCCLIYEIHKSTKHLRYHLAMNLTIRTIVYSEQMKITMMLVSIIVVFFICQAPLISLNVINCFIQWKIMGSPSYYQILLHCTSSLMTLKSLFNFILYCWFSEKFWNTFKRLFCIKYFARCNKHQNATSGPLSDHGTTNSMRKISVLNTRETIC